MNLRSFSDPSLSSMRVRLRTVALDRPTTFWEARSGSNDLKPIICEARGRNSAKSMDRIEKPRASSGDL
jgi:hypothetical protein